MILSLLLACSSTPSSPPEPAHPDIILMTVDTLRADHLGLYGYERPTSPRLDAFAAGGTWFRRAYAQAAWTLPSFATMLTGLYPFQHRVGQDAYHPDSFGRLDPALPTLASTLGDAGYARAAFVNNTFLAPEFGLQSGFEVYDWKGSGPDHIRSAEDTVTAGLAWLGQQERPALLWIHFMEPHLDYDPPADLHGTFAKGERPAELRAEPGEPDPFALMQMGRMTPTPAGADYTRALYDEELLAVDRAFGHLLDGLEGRWDHTVLAYTADHGEEFWEHGGFEHGHALYSQITQVPLVIAGAGVGVGVEDRVVEHTDLFQTLVRLAGAEAPHGTAGTDLLRLGDQHDRAALSENCLYGPPRVSLVDRRARLVVDQSNGRGEAWAMAPGGAEAERLQGEAQQREGERLLARLKAIRGDLEPITGANQASIPSAEVFQQLSALGYLDGPDDRAH